MRLLDVHVTSSIYLQRKQTCCGRHDNQPEREAGVRCRETRWRHRMRRCCSGGVAAPGLAPGLAAGLKTKSELGGGGVREGRSPGQRAGRR